MLVFCVPYNVRELDFMQVFRVDPGIFFFFGGMGGMMDMTTLLFVA